MNKKNLRVWEIKIGLTQLVVLVGAVSGSLLCAFLLGYFSGQRVGFEGALASTMANVARMPVAIERADDSPSEDVVSEVYARLGEEGVSDLGSDLKHAANEAAQKVAELPELSGIRKLTELDKIDELDLPQKAEAKVADSKAKKESDSQSLGSLIKPPVVEQIAKTAPETDTLQPLIDKPNAAGQIQRTEADTLKLAKIDRSVEVAKELSKAKGKKVDEPAAAKVNIPQKPAAPKLARGWFAQVAAPRKRADADAIVNKLRASGFKVSIEDANVRGEEYFRVMVGPEDNRQMAERLVDQLKREKYLKSDPFVRMVK